MSVIAKMWKDTFPPPPKFTEAHVPDLTGKVMFITGGNSGIGKETSRVLLNHNARVYIAARSPQKAQTAVNELKELTGKTDSDINVIVLDLADLTSIKAGVDDFLSKESRLDVLFNNGGIMRPPMEALTKDSLDLQFATNVLGHFYLTQLLTPILIASAKTSNEGKVRVVNVAGSGHLISASAKAGGPIQIETLVDGPSRNKGNPTSLFCQSKSGQIMFANALARKYGDQGIVATSLNPGMIRTSLWNEANSQNWLQDRLSADVDRGALTPLYAGTSPETLELNGKYLGPWARLASCRSDHNDPVKEDELWDWCEQQVAKFGPR